MSAIQSVFTNQLGSAKDTRKKVSFDLATEETRKKKKSNLSKSTTLKSHSSRERASEGADEAKVENFDKFFHKFMVNYAETGYAKRDGPSSPKMVYFMDNREDDEDSRSALTPGPMPRPTAQTTEHRIPLKAPRRVRIKETSSTSNLKETISKSPSKSILKERRSSNSPLKSGLTEAQAKVVVFDEEKIKEFMAQVWREMIINYGVIEQLQTKLHKSSTQAKSKDRSANKSSLEQSPMQKKVAKQSSLATSKSIKKTSSKLKLKKKSRLNKTEKLRKPPRKRKEKEDKKYFSIRDHRMHSEIDMIKFEEQQSDSKKKGRKKKATRRSSTVDAPKKASYSTKPKKKKKKNMSRTNTQAAWTSSSRRTCRASPSARRCPRKRPRRSSRRTTTSTRRR